MRIRILETLRKVTPAERTQMERIVRLSFGRFENLVCNADIRVGGNDTFKECQLELRLRSGGTVTVEESAAALDAAVRQAAFRATGVLDRRLTLRSPRPTARYSKEIHSGN